MKRDNPRWSTRAAGEATRLLKPLVQKVVKRLGKLAGRNVSER
jgi:hypothetical protein